MDDRGFFFEFLLAYSTNPNHKPECYVPQRALVRSVAARPLLT